VPRRLKADELELLHEVVKHQAPARADLRSALESNALTLGQRRELCELIGKEFMDSGLGKDDEPSPRGLRLEALLDAVNRPNRKPGDN
jgi:hypothetical protein